MVGVTIAYVLEGPLTQVSHGSLARDLAACLTETFATNLGTTIAGWALAGATPLNTGSLISAVLKGWLARLFRLKR